MKSNIRFFTTWSIISLAILASLSACSKNVEKFDGTSRDAFDNSMEIIAKQLNDKQKETIDHAFQLLGDEITDQISLGDESVGLNLTNEVLKKINGKTYGEVTLMAENYLQHNIDFKRAEIDQQIDELLQKKEKAQLEDKEQRKLAYLNEQQELWRDMRGTIAEFNFDYADELISANLAGRTQGKKQKVTGYEPYETEADKYRALYQTLYPKN